MRPTPWLPGALVLLLSAGVAPAETPSPLRLVPAEADLVVQVHQPRKLVESIITLELARDVQKIEAVKEALDSTQARRFFQLLSHFEKQLGHKTPELLDKVAGGGIVLAAKYGDKAPALLVMQGTDEAATRKFLAVALEVIEQELARQDAKVKPAKNTHQGVETISLGEDAHAAIVDGALLISNRADPLHRAIDLAKGKGGKSLAGHAGIKEAAKLLPADRLVSLWLNMEPVKKAPEFEAIYKTPRDPFITVVLGGWADVLGRSPFFCGALCRDDRGFLLTFRTPRGSEGMGSDRAVVCPDPGKAGSRPLLQPKDTLFSSSFYWDISRFWSDRVALFGEDRAKELEKFDNESGRFLSTIRFSKLLTATGPYHRLVVTRQPKAGYKRQPQTPAPAAAYVLELRKPEEFRKGVETILRTAGLFTTTQFGLKMIEEKHNGVDIVGYRFDEDKPLKDDPTDARFNLSPCFAAVGEQYVVASTVELCREVIDLLKREKPADGMMETTHAAFVSAGGKELLRNVQDQLIAASVLGQALPLEQAKEQVKMLLALFDRVDGLSVEARYAPRDFRYDLRLTIRK